MPLTAVIILNYNNFEDTLNCVRSVEEHNTAPIKYIVVDNGSTKDGAVENLTEKLRTRFGERMAIVTEGEEQTDARLNYLTLLLSKDNGGYAKGNNKGLQLAYSDPEIGSILILNNDILFTQDIIPSIASFADTHNDVAIVSPLLLKKGGKDIDYCCARTNPKAYEILWSRVFFYHDLFGLARKWNEESKLLLKDPSLAETNHFRIELSSGSCMFVQKDYFEQIGSFDERTFLYYEENILFEKIQKTGRSNYILPGCGCIHLGAGSTKSQQAYQLVKANLDSAEYYLWNYADCLWITKTAFSLVKQLFLLQLKLRQILKRLLKAGK